MSRWLLLLMLVPCLPAAAADSPASTNPQTRIQQLVDGARRDMSAFRAARSSDQQQQRAQLEQLREQVQHLQQALTEAKARQQLLDNQLHDQRRQLRAQQLQLHQDGGQLEALALVLREQAGEQADHYEKSLTALQLGQQKPLFDALTDSRRLPDMALLERWRQQLQQQLFHSGRVEYFPAEVIVADGGSSSQAVLRLGEFNLIDNRGYLLPTADFSVAMRLAQWPDSGGRPLLTVSQPGELSRLPLDPSRGELLSRLEQRQSWYQRLDQAGGVGVLIGMLFAVGLGMALERSWQLGKARSGVRRQLRQAAPSPDNLLGRVLLVGHRYGRRPLAQLERRLEEAILAELPELEKRLNMLKLLAALAPMLGLLGTVTGMIATFQDMTLYGSGDPGVLSDGIATALMTTVLGLLAAMPLMLLHGWLAGQSRELINLLDQQTAGLLAEQLEQHPQLAGGQSR